MSVTTKSIVEEFKTISQEHTAVNWFDFGTAEFLFNPQVDLEYPAVFLQLLGGSVEDYTRENRDFTLYVLYQSPDSFDYAKSDAFDYHSSPIDERDSALQVLREVIGRARHNNRRDWIVEEGSITFDNDTFSSAVGWRIDFTITTSIDYVDTNFPD